MPAVLLVDDRRLRQVRAALGPRTVTGEPPMLPADLAADLGRLWGELLVADPGVSAAPDPWYP